MSESKPKANSASGRGFRAILVGFLALLIVSGSSLQFANTATANQLAHSVPTHTKTHVASPTVTVPDPDPTTPAVEDPIITAIKAHQAATGCNLHLDASVPVRPVGTCKLLLVGDSLGNNLGYGMIPQLSGYKTLKFVLRAKASTGLSNSWFYNWETNLKSYLRTEKPNIVVVFLGANDRQNMRVGGQILTFGTSKWQAAYGASVARMTKLSTDAGAYVLWVGLPNCKPYNHNKGMELITSIDAKTVSLNPGARYIPLKALTSGANGTYTQYQYVNGSRQKTRGDDGIHFTANGQDVIGTFAVNRLASAFRVSLKPSHPHLVTK
jgi:hypothetical protein